MVNVIIHLHKEESLSAVSVRLCDPKGVRDTLIIYLTAFSVAIYSVDYLIITFIVRKSTCN